MTPPRFHSLKVSRISAEGEGAVAVTLQVPEPQRQMFAFEPGQFLILRTHIGGQEQRRSYSICSARSRLAQEGELEIGVRAVVGGIFSNWVAQTLRSGDSLEVMPPEGRFCIKRPRALHRAGFAAGSGITPILSIIASSLQEQPESKFTLVYGNRNMASVMFNEALQDLKDRYTDRLTLIHVLSRQTQEAPLLQGRIDADKVRAILDALLPARSMDEVFICGPEGMLDAAESALLAAGVPPECIRTERFSTQESRERAALASGPVKVESAQESGAAQAGATRLEVQLDGKTHSLIMDEQDRVLDVALRAGLDLPYSCRAGVCCTCRARVLEGQVQMERNFTLEDWEMKKGFVLTCQARAMTPNLVVSFDER